MCVALGVQFLQKSECDTSRTSIKGEFFSSKPKALLVSTFRGVPFYHLSVSVTLKTRRKGEKTTKQQYL